MELARAQITVNAIVPTAWTQMTETIPIYAPLVGRDEFPPEVRREHALGTPEDCAPLVVFLASEAAAGVTGQAIGIGGDRLSLYSHPAEIAHELPRRRLDARTRSPRRGSDVRDAQPLRRRGSPRAGPVVNVDAPRCADRRAHARRAQRGRAAGPGDGRVLAAAGSTSAAHPPQPTAQEVADYYRERRMAAVIFTVDDEAGMGRRRLGNDEVLAAAEANPDVLIPFASRRPAQGQARRCARRASWIERGVRGFKFHPNTQAFWPNDRAFYPLYEVIAEAGLIALFHSGTTGIGAGHAGRRRRAAEVLQPDAGRRRRRRLPRARHHPRPPVVPVAGRGAGDRRAQAERLHRPVRLVAEVLPGDPGALHEHPAQAQDAVRLGLPADHARPLAGGLREARRSATRCARSCSRRTRRGCSGYERPRLAAAARGARCSATRVAVRRRRALASPTRELAATGRARSATSPARARSATSAPNSLAHLECWLGVAGGGQGARDLNYRLARRGAARSWSRDAEIDAADRRRRAPRGGRARWASSCVETTRRWSPGRGASPHDRRARHARRDLLHRRHHRPPKGVMLSHRNLLANALHNLVATGHRARPALAARVPDVPRRRHRRTSSPARGWARRRCAAALRARGGAGGDRARAASRHTVLVPTMLAMLLDAPAPTTPTSRACATCSTRPRRSRAELQRRVLERLPDCDVAQFYGMTEAAPTVTHLSPQDHRQRPDRLASMGAPVPGVQVEVARRSPRRGRRAVGPRPERHARLLEPARRHRRGAGRRLVPHRRPRARADEDGYLYMVDRAKDMIITGGENVYSLEVEAVLAAPAPSTKPRCSASRTTAGARPCTPSSSGQRRRPPTR